MFIRLNINNLIYIFKIIYTFLCIKSKYLIFIFSLCIHIELY